MQKSRAFRCNLLFFHLSKKNKRISTAIAHAKERKKSAQSAKSAREK